MNIKSVLEALLICVRTESAPAAYTPHDLQTLGDCQCDHTCSRERTAAMGTASVDRGNTEIPMRDLGGNNNDGSSDEEVVQFSRDKRGEVGELPAGSVRVNAYEILFNWVVFLIVIVNLGVDVSLVFVHYAAGDSWGSGLTCAVLGAGGLALLGQFWGIPYDELGRIYARGKCVRILVNCFPWVATLITCYETTSTSYACRSNPMLTHRYVNLQQLNRSLLLAQGLAQCAPQALLQLVLLLEQLDTVSTHKALLLTVSIATNLTTIMVSNLPLKSSSDTPSAYNPYTRVYVGLRMVSSFGSRTLALGILFSTSRCLLPKELNLSPFLAHVIPFAVIVIPRLAFLVVDYTVKCVSKQKPRFTDLLISYVATVFIPFSEPPFVFWYVSVESIAFVAYGAVGELVTSHCFGFAVGSALLGVFLVLFGVVPCVVPAIRVRVSARP